MSHLCVLCLIQYVYLNVNIVQHKRYIDIKHTAYPTLCICILFMKNKKEFNKKKMYDENSANKWFTIYLFIEHILFAQHNRSHSNWIQFNDIRIINILIVSKNWILIKFKWQQIHLYIIFIINNIIMCVCVFVLYKNKNKFNQANRSFQTTNRPHQLNRTNIMAHFSSSRWINFHHMINDMMNRALSLTEHIHIYDIYLGFIVLFFYPFCCRKCKTRDI